MTDKVQKIREEVEKLYNQSLADENRQADRGLERAANVSYGKSKACKELLSFIDSMQEECNITGIKSRHATGKLKECIDNQTEERLEQTQKQLEENPQECMYARDNYTDEDRKILCDGCEEECEYAQKEDVWWLQELHNKLDSLSKEDFEKVWARYHQKEEPVSEELTDEIKLWLKQWSENEMEWSREDIWDTAEHFANWQKQKMMRGATDGQIEIGEDYLRIKCLCMSCPPQYDGKLVKLIIIKED